MRRSTSPRCCERWSSCTRRRADGGDAASRARRCPTAAARRTLIVPGHREPARPGVPQPHRQCRLVQPARRRRSASTCSSEPGAVVVTVEDRGARHPRRQARPRSSTASTASGPRARSSAPIPGSASRSRSRSSRPIAAASGPKTAARPTGASPAPASSSGFRRPDPSCRPLGLELLDRATDSSPFDCHGSDRCPRSGVDRTFGCPEAP